MISTKLYKSLCSDEAQTVLLIQLMDRLWIRN